MLAGQGVTALTKNVPKVIEEPFRIAIPKSVLRRSDCPLCGLWTRFQFGSLHRGPPMEKSLAAALCCVQS
jgi:hypothetical protein